VGTLCFLYGVTIRAHPSNQCHPWSMNRQNRPRMTLIPRICMDNYPRMNPRKFAGFALKPGKIALKLLAPR
jgi:hypothetical protein